MLTRFVVVMVILYSVAGCQKTSIESKKPHPPDYWPTEGWRTSTPEEQGVNSERLTEALAFIEERDINVHSMLIVRNGYLVLDAYFYPFASGLKHDLASVTKSFTSTLIGIAVDKGHIAGVKQPVLALFPERTVANVDAMKRKMTIEDILMMSSGLECHAEPNEITLFQMMGSPDWAQFMLDLPMRDEPGTHFEYCSGGSHLLSVIIHETTGMNEFAFARENLFGPLGISDIGWPTDPQGVDNHGWGDLHLKPHDMAKLGLLYLNGGLWDGRQLLSSEYAAAATSSRVSLPNSTPFDGYGYQWWISSSGYYAARGRGEQLILVIPARNMVVVLTSGIGSDEDRGNLLEVMTTLVLPAAESNAPLPANPEGMARLEAGIQEAALAPQDDRGPAPPLPDIAAKVSGRNYKLDSNPYGLEGLSVVFPGGEEALLRLTMAAAIAGQQQMELPVGLDGRYRISPSGRFDLPVALKGSWTGDTEFVIDFDEIGNINRWQITTAFEGETISVHMQEGTGLGEATFGGRRQ